MKTKLNANVNIITSLLVAGVICLAATLPVRATTFNVDTFSDELTTNGQCSLREAIVNANNNAATYPDCPAGEAGPVMDVINLPPGTYALSQSLAGVDERCDGSTPCTGTTDNYVPVVTYDARQGDLDITDDLTITGAGSDVTKIEWTPTSSGVPLVGDADPLTGDRIFQVSTTSTATADIASVVIQGVTLANGEVGLHPTSAYDVCVPDGTPPTTTHYDASKLNAYDIQVIDSTCGPLDADGKFVASQTSVVIDQFRRMGGAIALGGGYATVHYDSTQEGQPPVIESGGEGSSSFGVDHVTLNDVVVVNNWSGSDGGGIYSVVPTTISQSKISGNTTDGNGGGLYNEADTTISDTLIGKVFDAATAAAHPELTNRNYGENGGAIFFTGSPQTTLTILRSALNGNEAVGGAGIAAREAEVDMTNTTISKNTTRDVGAGVITSGPVYLRNVTVADNLATSTAPVGGAGLDSFGNGTYYMNNTLLSNNKSEAEGKVRLANCGCQGSNCAALYISQGYNLENGDSCNLNQAGDQINTDPLLVALADNGGPTETNAITHSSVSGTVDSPAVDAGDDNTCPNNDQRSSIRPADGNGDGVKKCDIGAFELFHLTPDLQIANMVAPDNAFKGDDFTVTITVTNGSANPDTGVVLSTAALPSNVTYVSATAAGGSVNTCGEASGVVTCNIGNLDGNAGANPSATVTLTLKGNALGDAVIDASVVSTNDVTPGNNTAYTTTTIVGESDLKLTATTDRTDVVLGNNVTATFTVTNQGADDATNVVFGTTLPSQVSLVSATPDNGTTCTQSDSGVRCELGNLAVAGSAVNVVLVMKAELAGAGGTATDVTAGVEADQRDPDASNNSATASFTIKASSSSSGGGFCSYHPNGKFDPVLPGLVFVSLLYLMWNSSRSRRKDAKSKG